MANKNAKNWRITSNQFCIFIWTNKSKPGKKFKYYALQKQKINAEWAKPQNVVYIQRCYSRRNKKKRMTTKRRKK